MSLGTHRHRRSIRLQGYDYTRAGAYFITVCIQGRAGLFGNVDDGEMRLNEAGRMVQSVWDEMPSFYPGVDIDEFIVMPNHIHGIVILVGAPPRGSPAPSRGRPDGDERSAGMDDGQAWGPAPTVSALSLPDVVHRFKTLTTKRYIDGVRQSDWTPFSGRIWQRNYYEHIIRGDDSLARIRQYIINNPGQWQTDPGKTCSLRTQGSHREAVMSKPIEEILAPKPEGKGL